MRYVWILMAVMLSTVPAVLPNAGFERIKSLVGEWVEPDSAFTVDYRLISDGTAVLESIHSAEHSDNMTSIYYIDGEQVMMTHFCAENNQPRMKSTFHPENETLDFDFLDATNLPDPAAGHMVKLVLQWQDENHVTQEWTYREAGKDQQLVFPLSRKVKQPSLIKDIPCVDHLYHFEAPVRPSLVPVSGVSRWESECSRFDQRRAPDKSGKPEKTACTCRKCDCK